MSNSTFYDVTLQLHHSTDRAVLMSEDGDNENAKWLPKSQIEMELKKGADGVPGAIYAVTMPQWLAEKSGFV